MTVNGVPVRVHRIFFAVAFRLAGGIRQAPKPPRFVELAATFLSRPRCRAAAIGVARQGTQAPPISLLSVHNVSAAVAASYGV